MPATLPPSQFIKLPNKTELAYLDVGPNNAPVILFLHGLGDSAQIWHPTIAALQTSYRCLALDLPGHGQSPIPAGFGFQPYAYADVVMAFLKTLKISSFFLAGHSMGGQIGIILALRLPSFIQKLVLVAPAGFEQFNAYEKKLMQLGASFGNNWGKSGNQTTTEAVRQLTLQKSMEGMLNEPVFDFLSQLTVPTLVIFGDQDAFIPNRYLHPNQTSAQIAREGSSQIPNAELVLFNRCNHYPQTEQPQAFVKSVVSFLQKGL